MLRTLFDSVTGSARATMQHLELEAWHRLQERERWMRR